MLIFFLDKSNTLCFLEQVQDLWRAKNENMAGLCKKVKELKGTFHLFQIRHVLRVGVTSFLCFLTLFNFLLDQPALQFAMFMCCAISYSTGTIMLAMQGFMLTSHIINSQKIPHGRNCPQKRWHNLELLVWVFLDCYLNITIHNSRACLKIKSIRALYGCCITTISCALAWHHFFFLRLK